jgi:alpha-galactosidase
VFQDDFPVDEARRLISQYMRVRHLYHGDFYPLLPHSVDDDVWMAYQFHREDLDQGMFLAFRRPVSPYVAVRLRLKGLGPRTRYEVANEDTGEKMVFTGRELSEGHAVTIDDVPGSLLMTYQGTD